LPTLVEQFNTLMAFEPYNIFYLSIVASKQHERWSAREDFFKKFYNHFNQRSFSILSKYKKDLAEELLSTGPNSETEGLKNIAKKLKDFREKHQEA